MRGVSVKRAALLGPLLLAGCIEARPLNRPDLLPPLPKDHRAQIVKWAGGFFAEPAALRNARISRPLSMEDRTQNPLWLVCVDVDVRTTEGASPGPQRFAFGFHGALLQSAPQRRGGGTLTSADCERFPLAWAPFPELERIKAPPRLR